MRLEPLRNVWRYVRDCLSQWTEIAGCAARDFVIDDGIHWSAAVAFYGVLSLFPLVLAGVDIAAWFIDPHGASQQASRLLSHVMPHADTVRDIIDKAIASRHRSGPISIVFLLYAGGRAFAILIRALNIAGDRNEIDGFLPRLLQEMGMLLSIGLLFLGTLVTNLLAPVFGYVFEPLPQGKAAVMGLIGWSVPPLLLLGGFFCLYKFIPRRLCNWQSSAVSALVATTLCVAAKPLFTVYVSRLASYSQIYGWLTIGIVFMIWAQILSIITLYGGELASHIQMMVYDGLSGQEVGRRHRLRSPGRAQR